MSESRRLLQHFLGALENFIFAKVSASNVSSAQALPAAPDLDWRAEETPLPPGPRRPR